MSISMVHVACSPIVIFLVLADSRHLFTVEIRINACKRPPFATYHLPYPRKTALLCQLTLAPLLRGLLVGFEEYLSTG